MITCIKCGCFMSHDNSNLSSICQECAGKLVDGLSPEEHSSIYKTRIIISKDGVKFLDIDSESLKIAIEALEKSCWRP